MDSEFAFNISVLASGSTGNSLFIETNQKKVLVDAGLSGKKITSLLAEVNRKPEDLDAILVTHEHRDHIHGVGVLARKYKLDVYANEKTWQAMDRGTIENADAYLVESNHEIEILRAGPYPWSLKQRILGDKGHLSNDDGALVMADVLGDKTKRIYLGHLSKENNTKLHARMAMESTLKQKDLGVGEAFKVYDTDPDSASELFQI